MTRTGPRHDQAGFTLVEVMVSLMIFGMLAAAGVAILSFSVRAQGQTAAKFDDLGALNRTIALLSGDLAQARPRPARDAAGTLLPAFVGESNAAPLVRFVRSGWSNIDGAPRASSQKVEYRLVEDRLERLAYPMLDGAAPLAPVPLLTRVRALGARYRYRGAWSDRWDGSAGAALPDAFELSVQRADGTTYRAVALVGSGYQPEPAKGPGNATP
jgi:general secretion pathway protein J